jgi:hypothetical protein
MLLSFVCRSCLNWSNPPLDLTSTAAPFMFAVGPISDETNARWSNYPDAPLRTHSIHGSFTMNMQVATVQSGDGITVPDLGNATVGASSTASVTFTPHDWTSAIHAVVLCLAFGLLYPLDALLLRLFRKTKLHYVFQSLIAVLFVVGIGLGFSTSMLFVRVSLFPLSNISHVQ